MTLSVPNEDVFLNSLISRDSKFRLRWSRVRQISPITVRHFGDSADVAVSGSLLPPELLTPGDRVITAQEGTSLILLGSREALGRIDTALGTLEAGIPPSGVLMPAGADFNTYTTPGTFYNPASAQVATMPNKPPSGQAGALQVLNSAGTIQLWYEYNILGQGRTWRRRFYSGAWSDWWVDSDPEWGRWKAYSPAMSHTGYNGGATLTGRYTTFRDTMQGTINVKVTSPAHMGTGQWLISLPQAGRAYNLTMGVGHYYAGSSAWVVSVLGAGTGIIGVLAAGAGRISATSPAAVGTTTELTISFEAELMGAP